MYQYKICFVLVAIAVLMVSLILDQYYLLMMLLASAITWLITFMLIPKVSFFMLNNNKFGYDLNKKGSEMGDKKIPECVGFSAAIGFIIVNLFYYSPENYTTHLACLLTISLTVLLGFADDMLDLLWRYKLIFPFFIVLPVVRVYSGSTAIFIPYPVSLLIGDSLDIGYLFYLYITLLGIYCTNAINIYAGINGL